MITSHMFHENAHVPYKNIEVNPRTSPSKIIDCNKGDIIDFHINQEQVPTKDTKSKDQTY